MTRQTFYTHSRPTGGTLENNGGLIESINMVRELLKSNK
jgi:hypothetical protein